MLKLYLSEVAQELAKHPPLSTAIITDSVLGLLPEPVRRYFRACGWLGKPVMTNAAIDITRMQLKMDLKRGFLPVKSLQFNSVAEPVRIAYLKAKMFGLIPFSGRDKFQDGTGHMLIRICNLLTVVNQKGPEMDQSALVTVLAECFLAPSYALQPYMSWQAVDQNTAKATLSFRNVSVSGSFHFNEAGELVRFETSDRYMRQQDGTQKQMKWIALFGDYQERNGVRIATEVKACWLTDSGPQEYARMLIGNVRYDIRCAAEVLTFR